MKDKPFFFISGAQVDFDNPDCACPTMDDFYTCMKNICRYNGSIPVSLLQHVALCVLLAWLYVWFGKNVGFITRNTVKAVAIHDHAEVFVNDLHPAIKTRAGGYSALEHRFDKHVRQGFGLLPISDEERMFVKWIDDLALNLETWAYNHPAHPYTYRRVSKKILFSEKLAMIAVILLPNRILWGIITSATGAVKWKKDESIN